MNRIPASRHICAALLLLTGFTSCRSTKQTDLANIQFTEQADKLLRDIPAERISRENNVIRYDIKDVHLLPFQGIVMDSYVKVGAQNGVISYYSAETNKTMSTNFLLAALIKRFGRPTKKLRDDLDSKAYYWITPTMYIRYMRGSMANNQLTAFIEVAPIKALHSGASPGMLDAYEMIKHWNNADSAIARQKGIINGPVPPDTNLIHTIRPN